MATEAPPDSDGRPEEKDLTAGMADRRLGAYRVLRSLGRGGMGEVFLAERADGAFEGRVALKLVSPDGSEETLQRFRAERQTLANLEHPHIARLLDAGTTEDDRPYLVMEHVDGVRIDQHCNDRQLSLEERLELFLDVCDAVQHAHRNLIVHRDLKPDNILVGAEGEAKLLDFGIAKLLPGATGEQVAVETLTGKAAMSLMWASPEQMLGEPITTATDVHALGLLLYVLLTGRHPYAEDSAVATGYAVLHNEALAPSRVATEQIGDLPPDRLGRRLEGDLDTITLAAMRKEPERRYPSVEALAEDIRRHLDGRPVRARPDTLHYRTTKFLRRHRLAVGGAALILLSILGGVGATLWQARIAEQRASDIRTLAGSLIFEVDDLIRDLPGSTPARQQIVTRALTYLDRLAVDSDDDPELLRELALAYQKVGNIQGNPNTSNLGDTRGALATYRKALGLAERAVRRDPEGAGATRSVAVIHEKLGDTLAYRGDLNAAGEAAAAALDVFEDLAERYPDVLRHQISFAISSIKMGDLEGNPDFPNLGRSGAALATYRRAEDLLDDLSVTHPEDATVRRYRALIQERLATVLLAAGELEAATTSARESLSIRRDTASAQSGNTEAQRDVAVALEKLGDVLLRAGETESALAEIRSSFEIFGSIATADPQNASAQRSLAISHRKVAEGLEAAGRTDEALMELEASRRIVETLLSADPQNTQLRELLAELVGQIDPLRS